MPVVTQVSYRLGGDWHNDQIRVFVTHLVPLRFAVANPNFLRGKIGARTFQCRAHLDKRDPFLSLTSPLGAEACPRGVEIAMNEKAVSVRIFSATSTGTPGRPMAQPVSKEGTVHQTRRPIGDEPPAFSDHKKISLPRQERSPKIIPNQPKAIGS